MARICLGFVGADGQRFLCPARARVGRGRCPSCRRAHDLARRPSTAARGYDAAWQRQSAATIAGHVAIFGWACPGAEGHRPHPSTDLVLDHVVNGDRTWTRVICRSWNTAKRNRERTR